jgi:hypothetical protein
MKPNTGILKKISLLLPMLFGLAAGAEPGLSSGNEYELRRGTGQVTVVCRPVHAGERVASIQHFCAKTVLHPAPQAKVTGVYGDFEGDEIDLLVQREGWEGSIPPVLKDHFDYNPRFHAGFVTAEGRSAKEFDLFFGADPLLHVGRNVIHWQVTKASQPVASGLFYVKVIQPYDKKCDPGILDVNGPQECVPAKKAEYCEKYFRAVNGRCR